MYGVEKDDVGAQSSRTTIKDVVSMSVVDAIAGSSDAEPIEVSEVSLGATCHSSLLIFGR